MKLITPVLAGAALLAFGSVAQAEEPIQLTDAQMDSVSAGFANGGNSSQLSCNTGGCSASASGSSFINIFDNGTNASANASQSHNLSLFAGSVSGFFSSFAGSGV